MLATGKWGGPGYFWDIVTRPLELPCGCAGFTLAATSRRAKKEEHWARRQAVPRLTLVRRALGRVAGDVLLACWGHAAVRSRKAPAVGPQPTNRPFDGASSSSSGQSYCETGGRPWRSRLRTVRPARLAGAPRHGSLKLLGAVLPQAPQRQHQTSPRC